MSSETIRLDMKSSYKVFLKKGVSGWMVISPRRGSTEASVKLVHQKEFPHSGLVGSRESDWFSRGEGGAFCLKGQTGCRGLGGVEWRSFCMQGRRERTWNSVSLASESSPVSPPLLIYGFNS